MIDRTTEVANMCRKFNSDIERLLRINYPNLSYTAVSYMVAYISERYTQDQCYLIDMIYKDINDTIDKMK